MNDKLAICIPTYNRAELLKENLQGIISIVEEKEIGIYVSDNASQDNTEKIVRELQSNYKYLYYCKNDVNVGVDRNFEKVLKMPDTEYIWLLGDDDRIKNRIDAIIGYLDINNPDVLLLSNGIAEGVYSNRNYIFNTLINSTTWMSMDIFSRKVIQKASFNTYYDSNFLHTGIILDYLGRYGMRIDVINNIYVEPMRLNYCEYTKRTFEIYAKGWTNLIMSVPGFNYTDKLAQCRTRGKNGVLSNKELLSLRSRGVYNREVLKQYGEYIRLYNNSPRIVLMLLSFFPIRIAKIVRRLYRSFCASRGMSNDLYGNN